MPQVHVIISGKVQGCFFRMHTHKKATALKLTGYVRNLPDETVEAYAEGPQEKLEEFVQFCHEGPPAAQVENVDVEWMDEEKNQFTFFQMIQ
ncbi:MAG: acylphosphatase [Deltaproteobacteria bacterium]|nr:acylphosphatase [Deltaproteobacteria bacterium]